MRAFQRILKLAAALGLTVAAGTGCWDYKDINHRSLPVVLGLQTVEEGYRVFLKLPEPKEKGTDVKVVSSEGHTITKAIDQMAMNLESEVDLLHLKIILVHVNLAQMGMGDVFEFFMRARDISPKALVVICDEELEPFFRKIGQRADPNVSNLFDFFEKNAGWSPQIALSRVWQVYRSVHSYTRDVVVPIIRSGGRTTIEHIGSAVIRNGRMVGRISPDETLLFNVFNGESGQGKIEVMKNASVMISGTRVKRRGWMDGDTPRLAATLNLSVDLIELKEEMTEDQVMRQLSEQFKSRFDRLFEQVRKEKADIFAFGQDFRRCIPRERLRDWREEDYGRLKVDFRARVDIENDGYIKTKQK
ncbi:Ger(x)C family spore germination protein [Cohnella thailandensis]|uniref:Ger(X)C family spore germination protein n=1 Tax=Cohnella thailandensis TaxID=557557 RepID=A0A841T3C0_9BACL|nr:Ger(x)C family spore germination protein [Cohnella thailandensis]MBB6635601.1 Ger(x)C family spore germination protein [Cohnella thailandensis]MBP1974981.1 Ger(x)C family germination protein [Cohnella thailandensis]